MENRIGKSKKKARDIRDMCHISTTEEPKSADCGQSSKNAETFSKLMSSGPPCKAMEESAWKILQISHAAK